MAYLLILHSDGWTAMRRPQLFLWLALSLLLTVPGVQAKKFNRGQPGQFDYYAMALSWSPNFCATRNSDPDQCDSGRQLGFVLHGLWPQYEAGYPESCSSERLSAQSYAKYAPLFPSPKLVSHEWNKHGTCSGLDQASYFDLSARLKDQLLIPRQLQKPQEPVRITYNELVKSFKSANPGMPINAVLPFCGDGGRFLREVHACFTRTGTLRACSNGQVKRSFSSCRGDSFLIQSVR